ncbi:MAG: 16S rRNA (adenine(1518)-N(6)/adenine(1519)-N(6))-dimethyltransferase RsmA [Smithellaceae bacterium]
MSSPKDVIKHYDIKPRKKLGQSFLLDQNIIRKIAAAALISKEDIVVEIGAGIGVLTEILAQKSRKIIAVELDKNLVEVLKEKLAGYENVEIHSGDILKFDFNSISNTYGSKVRVVGNVPYNISSPLIFHLLSFRSVIDDFILMLQKEVVGRLVAMPDNKNYGVPSVLLQMFSSVEKIFDVPASCFFPQPKVESAVMRGTFLDKPLIELSNEAFFTQLVKAAFAQRRKMLINNLKNSNLLINIKEENIKGALVSAGISGRCRGETLSVAEFGNLSNLLYEAIVKL